MCAQARTRAKCSLPNRQYPEFTNSRLRPRTLPTTRRRRGWTLKSFHEARRKTLYQLTDLGLAVFAAGWAATAIGALPDLIRNTEARTEIEAAFFRLMSLPGGEVLFRRPPRETRPALG